jgi:hypothetical protein
VDALLAEVEGMDMAPPDEADEGQKKQAHAFEKLRQGLRTAKAVIEEQKKQMDAQSASRVSTPSAPVAAQPTVDARVAAEMVITRLANQAMINVGVADPTNPLVQLEVNRLYQQEISRIERAKTAPEQAKKILNGSLASFSGLSADDVGQIQERVSRLSLDQQLDENAVRGEIHRYVGENFERFRTPPAGAPAPSASTSSGSPGVGPAAASGVRLGMSSVPVNTGGPAPQPLTSVEGAEMRRVKLDPTKAADVALFRKAQGKKHNYPASI